jgi:hypothetical protein
MIQGSVEPPSSALIVGWIIGSVLGALMRDVPTDGNGVISELEQERAPVGS